MLITCSVTIGYRQTHRREKRKPIPCNVSVHKDVFDKHLNRVHGIYAKGTIKMFLNRGTV